MRFQVLQTGQEINELDQSGFNVTSPTILAANVGSNRFIVQVCPSSVRLLDAGASVVQDLELPANFTTVSASAIDPHVALLGQDGRIGLVRFTEGSRLELTFPIPPKNSPAVCLCLFRDVSGLFTTVVPESESSAAAARLQIVNDSLNTRKEMDDEDEYLYGDTEASDDIRMSSDDPEGQLTPQQR